MSHHPSERPPKKPTGAVPFPDYVESYLGKEGIDGVELMAAELAEYDELLMNKALSQHDVMEYLAVSGLLDSYPNFVKSLGFQMSKSATAAEARFKAKGYDAKKIDQRITGSIGAWRTALMKTGRPLLGAAAENVLRVCESHGLFQLIYKRNQKIPLTDYFERMAALHNTLENKTASDHIAFFALLTILQKQKFDLPSDVSASAEMDADTIFRDITKQEILPGREQVSFNINEPHLPFLKKVFLDTPTQPDPLVWMKGAIDYNVRLKGTDTPVLLNFSISVISGELTLGDDSFRSLAEVGPQPEFKKVYPLLRKAVFTCVAQAITDGRIQVTHDDIAEQLAALDVTPLEPALPETEPKPSQPKPTAVEIRNVSYGRVIAALERCGVEVTSGGKHRKLTKETATGKISVPFVNPHAGKSATMVRVLKSVLKILNIPQEKFLEKLY